MFRPLLLLLVALVTLAVPAPAASPPRLAARTTVHFATLAEGQNLLTASDSFRSGMTAADRRFRVHLSDPVSEEKYLDHVRKYVREWQPAERARLTRLIEKVRPRLARYPLPLPEQIVLVRTTGFEEDLIPYSRQNAIVLTDQAMNRGSDAYLEVVLAQEAYHIASRNNPDFRHRLYAALGFKPCPNQVAFPEAVESKRITNPDGPGIYYLSVEIDKKPVAVTPIQMGTAEPAEIPPILPFSYGTGYGLLALDIENGQCQVRLLNEKPFIYPFTDGDYIKRVGENGDLAHPDRIVAGNYALAVFGSKKQPPSPQVLARLKPLFAGKGR